MSRRETHFQLIERIYDAATDPDEWRVFLEELSVAVGGAMTCLTLEHPGRSERSVAISHGLDDAGGRLYSDHYVSVDPFQRVIRNEPEGVVNFGDPFVPPHELERTEIFNDWYRPNGLSTASIGGTVMKRGDVPSVLGLYKTRGTRPYDAEDLDLIQLLMPHLKRALQIHYRLGEAARTNATLFAVLDELAFGVVLVNAQGHVIAANRAARELATQEDSFHLGAGQIRGGRPAETRELQRSIQAAIDTTAGRGTAAGGVVPIRRRPPKSPVELLVSPLRIPIAQAGLAGIAAAVFVNDPDRISSAPETHLRELYGLTPREAAVASQLSEGLSPSEIADRLGIKVTTVKARLQEIFAKTRTHRQAELVRLLLTHTTRARVEA